MLSRIGFRRILPLSFFALHLALSFYGYYTQPDTDVSGKRVRREQRLDAPRRDTPVAWDVDIALNLPAFVCGFILVLLTRTDSNIAGLICASPFILILWFGIGRWVDRQLKWLPTSHRKGLRRVLSVGGVIIPVIFLVLILSGISAAANGESRWQALTLACWALLVLAMGVISLVRPVREN